METLTKALTTDDAEAECEHCMGLLVETKTGYEHMTPAACVYCYKEGKPCGDDHEPCGRPEPRLCEDSWRYMHWPESPAVVGHELCGPCLDAE